MATTMATKAMDVTTTEEAGPGTPAHDTQGEATRLVSWSKDLSIAFRGTDVRCSPPSAPGGVVQLLYAIEHLAGDTGWGNLSASGRGCRPPHEMAAALRDGLARAGIPEVTLFVCGREIVAAEVAGRTDHAREVGVPMGPCYDRAAGIGDALDLVIALRCGVRCIARVV